MADNFNLRSFLTENKLTKNAQLLKEEVSLNGKPVDIRSIEIDGIDMNDYPDFVDAYIIAADFEDGTPLTDDEVQQFQDENYDLVGELIHDRQLYLEGEKEEVPENPEDYTKQPGYVHETLTANEKKLVEMVENALGITPPTPPDLNEFGEPVYEEEIEEAKPLPKYNSIEELMKEIEHGTNEAAHKYKMDEMKRVYEALEAKVGSLEEGEHAEHIDQKAVKQMRKDIAALRKAEEKLRKEFDKKFTGKEKKETPAKKEAVEALQEGTFDLRKFLTENKLTAGSRLLKEEIGTPINYEKLKQILLLACNTYPEDDEDGSALYEKEDVKHTLKYIMTLEKGVKNDDFDVFDKLEGQEPTTLEGIVNLDDVQSTKWDDFDLALSVVSSVAYEYDLDDAASALGDLANAVDSFQL